MAVIKKLSLVDQVYERLRESIIHMEIPLGARLNVSKLQEEYHVSSTPVREAMNRLLNDGLIEFENNVGARVVDLDKADIRELLEVSVSQELSAMCLAIYKGNCKALGRKYADQMARIRQMQTAEEYEKGIRKLKELIYRYADNKRLLRQVETNAAQNQLLKSIFTFQNAENVEKYKKMLPYLERIGKAISAEDVAESILALNECIDEMEQYMIYQVEQVKVK